MKNRRLLAVAGTALILGALISAGPSAAKMIRFDQWAVGCVLEPGMEWVSDDGVLHGRGRVEAIVNYSYDHDLGAAVVVGSGTSIGNADIDLATGDGNFFGVFSMIYLPLSAEGTFDGTWVGTLTGWVEFYGASAADGTGPLSHSKLRLWMRGDPAPAWLEDELAVRPPPCGRENAAINRNVVIIRGRPAG